MDTPRTRRLIERAIRTFDLALDGKVVLTEAATGWFALTPLIAALAGADRVYALTRGSRFGSVDDVRVETMRLADAWKVGSKIEVLTSREDPLIRTADIVTNLGFVRPLDATFLGRLNPAAAISLMWETWEWRSADLDLSECRRLGIPVLGTDEHHPDLRTFEYLGPLALKLLLEAEIEVVQSRIVVLGSGEFAANVVTALGTTGADVIQLAPDSDAGLSAADREGIRVADAIVVVEHHYHGLLIGPGGLLEAPDLASLNPAVMLVHICGGVDQAALKAAGVSHHPDVVAPVGYMSATTAYLGARPIIDLHTAGLRVGQQLADARGLAFQGIDAERWAAASCSLAQRFPDALTD